MDASRSAPPDDIEALKEALAVAQLRADVAEAELAVARADRSARDAIIAHLKLQIAKLKRDRFGVSSERTARLLDQLELQWDRRTALGVVMAAHGYPAAPRKGDAFTALPDAAAEGSELKVFHAGTLLQPDGQLVTSGGRVLCVTALGESVKHAQQRALAGVQQVAFEGAHWRTDIGHRAIRH